MLSGKEYRQQYQTVSSKSTHAAAAKRVRASIYAMCMRPGMILCSAERLYVHSMGILPYDLRVVVTSPIFAEIIYSRCRISARSAYISEYSNIKNCTALTHLFGEHSKYCQRSETTNEEYFLCRANVAKH